MKNLYIVTGANGHLGNTIIRILLERGERVRGLILPSEEPDFPDRAEYVKGDVTEPESLRALFEGAERASVVDPYGGNHQHCGRSDRRLAQGKRGGHKKPSRAGL